MKNQIKKSDDSLLASKTLQALPWHQHQQSIMVRQLHAHILGHAILLHGPSGVGKLKFAYDFASLALCSGANKLKSKCGHCKSCLLIQSQSHPDLVSVMPEKEGKPITISQVRELMQLVRTTAKLGGKRIFIINPADALNVYAANAFLKGLEEPGQNTLFLLVSAHPKDISITIRSRCQKLNFPLPKKIEALNWLNGHTATTDSSHNELALNLANGSPLKAQKLLANNELEIYQILVQSIRQLVKGEKSVAELSKFWISTNLIEVLGWLSEWLDDALRWLLTQDINYLSHKSLQKMARYFAQKSTGLKLIELRDFVLTQRHLLLLRQNLNIQILIETVFCRYVELVV